MSEIRYCESGVPHVFDPDAHFCCKARYWREQGAPAVHYAGGREGFHNAQGTLADRERQAVADARRGGYEPERYVG